MIITIQKRRRDGFKKRSFFYEYITFEVESFRWEKKHIFSYVKKGACRWEHLEDDEELVGMQL